MPPSPRSPAVRLVFLMVPLSWWRSLYLYIGLRISGRKVPDALAARASAGRQLRQPGEGKSHDFPTTRRLTARGLAVSLKGVDEITLQVERDEDSGWLVASWDAPNSAGGITTQGQDLRNLQQQVTEAVSAYFDGGAVPRRIRLHFASDAILVQP
jgi:hypothetical protein